MKRRSMLGLGVAIPFMSWSPRASAQIHHQRFLPYVLDVVWPTALRYLRVDRSYSIVDRDREAGFILFEIELGQDRTARGSVELYTSVDSGGREGVSVRVGTDAGPTYLPQSIVDGLLAKLRAERGMPPVTPPAEEKPADPPKNPPAKPDAKPDEPPSNEEDNQLFGFGED